jgi:hypothetical protein
MQPAVARSHMPATPGGVAADTGMVSMPHSKRPTRGPKTAMVPPCISEKLTIAAVYCCQECLRQGCTLLATYKCTLPLFLALLGGLRTNAQKWSQTGNPLVNHGAV